MTATEKGPICGVTPRGCLRRAAARLEHPLRRALQLSPFEQPLRDCAGCGVCIQPGTGGVLLLDLAEELFVQLPLPVFLAFPPGADGLPPAALFPGQSRSRSPGSEPGFADLTSSWWRSTTPVAVSISMVSRDFGHFTLTTPIASPWTSFAATRGPET